MVYQDPGTALNPSMRVGKQLARSSPRSGVERGEARERSLRDAPAGADRRPGVRHGALPAPALRRHAAARRDRHGARRRPRAAGPRRADDGPRRDGRGRGARPGRGAAGRVPHRRPVHQPQPRRDPQDVRPGRRDVRRRDGRGGRRRAGLRRPAAPLHRRSAALHPARRRAQGPTAARHDPRLSCRRSAPICRAASSSTAARSPRSVCHTEKPPLVPGRRRPLSRCYFHERGAAAAARDAADLEGAGTSTRAASRWSASTT